MFLFFYFNDGVRGLCVERKDHHLKMDLLPRYFRPCTSMPYLKAKLFDHIIFDKK